MDALAVTPTVWHPEAESGLLGPRLARAGLYVCIFLIYSGVMLFFTRVSPLITYAVYSFTICCMLLCIMAQPAVLATLRSVVPLLIWLLFYAL